MSSPPEKKRQQIYIGKLPRKVREEDLRKEFERYGKIEEFLPKLGYAFIVNSSSHIPRPTKIVKMRTMRSKR